MGTTKQINIKNWTYYFYNDIENFDVRLIKIDKKSYKDINFTILDTSQRKKLMIVWILIVLILCIFVLLMQMDILKKKEWTTDENKELLKKDNDVFNRIRDKITEINNNKCEYEKDYMKIKFNSEDDLPLNKPLEFRLMTITIRHVVEEGNKFYPQIFLDDTLYELSV